MILTALNEYYQRLFSQGKAPDFGFSRENISYALIFSSVGEPLAIDDLRDISGKTPRSSLYTVPYDKGRTSGVMAYPLWDKTSYAFGVTAGNTKNLEQQHETFKQRQYSLFHDTDDPELLAFLQLVIKWQPDKLGMLAGYSEDILDKNFIFRLDGARYYLHEHPPARNLWQRVLDAQLDNSTRGPCLVTGERAPLGMDHPKISNVNGAQSSGASLVSFNENAYESYGHKGQANASISRQAIFGYTTALNYLLRRQQDNHQRLIIGDTTTVFWARADDHAQADAAEQFFTILNEPPTDEQESARLKTTLDRVAAGTALADTGLGLSGDTQFFVLGLAPNAARLSVRFWCMNTLEQLVRHFAQHQQDLALEPRPWGTAFPPIWRLPYAVAPHRSGGKAKAEDIPPQMSGEIARAVFTGQRYPQSLLSNIVMRFRNDSQITGIRVALCKAVLTRNVRLTNNNAYSSPQEIPVSLDPASTNPGYLLGRLFAEIENAQKRAIPGANATVGDRYYGAASATPASIFPLLLRNVRNHLGKLRKGSDKDRAAAVAIGRNMQDIVDGLNDHFPKSLKIEDQGRFAIGYYHQSKARFNKSNQSPSDDNDAMGDN